MSAYSAAMPVACSTVTRNVNSLPISKCSAADRSSPVPTTVPAKPASVPAALLASGSSEETLESPRPESASSTAPERESERERAECGEFLCF